MKIESLISKDLVLMDLKSESKKEVIKELATLLLVDERISSLEDFVQAVNEREALSSTGVGYGIAIPHAKDKSVLKPSLVFGRSLKGIDYDSLDGEDANLFFLIAAPSDGANLHLQTLAKLSRNLMNDDFREDLRNASSKEELLSIINAIDKEEK